MWQKWKIELLAQQTRRKKCRIAHFLRHFLAIISGFIFALSKSDETAHIIEVNGPYQYGGEDQEQSHYSKYINI